MRDNRLIGITAGVVGLGSVLGLAFTLSGGCGPHLDPAPFEMVGRALARQAVALRKPGGHVTVITRDTVVFENPASDAQMEGFRKQLGRSGVELDSIQTIQIDPLRPTLVPAGDFFQLIRHAGSGDVLVSFMGPPILSEIQITQLGEVKPAIVAFCSGPARDQVDLRSLFTRGLLKAAVISKRAVAPKPSGTIGEREAFDRQYLEVTSDNLTALASISNPGSQP